LIDFSVNGLEVGTAGNDGRTSVLSVASGEPLEVSVRASAFLNEEPIPWIKDRPLQQKPYWHVERARVSGTRKVPVELIVNGESVETIEIDADGRIEDLKFDYVPDRSCWVAMRVFPSSHTNPVFVEVDGKPIRASKRSAQWCLDAIDACWNSKVGNTYARDREAAEAAYEFAREAYREILAESHDDR
jgi:hypothetical protein